VNPYVFLVGCPRSGTTLLQRMLDHHPQLAVANDTHFIPHGVDRKTVEIDPPLTAVIVERVRTYRRFHRLGVTDEAVAAAASRARTYSEFVRGLYDELASARGKPLAGDKTPSYVRQLPLLHALFPSARVVHIIRDGRDTALSALEWAAETKGPSKLPLWQDEPVGVCALWWRRHVRTGMADGARMGPSRYYEVRYERVVADAERELRLVAAFLGLVYAPEMATFYVGKTRFDPGLSAKHAWLPPTPGLRDWRSDMGERDIALFEALAGDLLDQLGYPRVTSSISRRERERAASIRQRFAEESPGRRRLPDGARARSRVS
jgi:Sulfotransferase family